MLSFWGYGWEGHLFQTCTHPDVADALETISAAFAIFTLKTENPARISLVSANSLFGEVVSKQVVECVGLSLAEFVPRYIEKQIADCMRLCADQQLPQETELVIGHGNLTRWWRVLAAPVIPLPSESRVIVTMIDITDKKLLEKLISIAQQRFEAVVDTAQEGIVTIDQNQKIKMINDAALEMFGISREAALGEGVACLIPERNRDKHDQYVDSFRRSSIKARAMDGRPPLTGVRADGIEFPIEVTISKITVDNEIEMTAVIHDISERTKLMEQLQQAAKHDGLTGIFNRRHGYELIEAEMRRCTRFGHALTLASLDLDNFKFINDQYGHACGDNVLVSTVATIQKMLRATDMMCRWGGEEFLIMLAETKLEDAVRMAERLREAVASQTVIGPQQEVIRITASFGLAEFANDKATLEEVLRCADKALYQAKDGGRNRVCAGDTVFPPN
jgi:diguanylate cyclase (GGDEF)-like protein/PAS domain S-box-containing protein